MIFGKRIEQARKLSGYTRKELAVNVGVTQSAIAHFESDSYPSSEDVLESISIATGFLPSFFAHPCEVVFYRGSLGHRDHCES